MIVQEGKKWKLYSKDGSKLLGIHSSKNDAKRQEIAISISKEQHKKK